MENQYIAMVEVHIYADSDEEAFKLYCSGEWDVQGHTLSRVDDALGLIDVDES